MPDIPIRRITAGDLLDYRATYQPSIYFSETGLHPIQFFASYSAATGISYTPREIINHIIDRYNHLEPGYTLIPMRALDLTELNMLRLAQHIFPYFERVHGLKLKRYSSFGTTLQVERAENCNSNNSIYRMALPEPILKPGFLKIK